MKKPYESRTWQAAMIIIAIAVLRMFGVIGSDGQIKPPTGTTIGTPQSRPDDDLLTGDRLIDVIIAAAGFMAIKGRQQATEPTAPLLGGQSK